MRPAAAVAGPAAAAPPAPQGPALPLADGQQDGGRRERQHARQYCWWVTFAHPLEETVQRLQLKTPSDFTRQSFLELVQTVFRVCDLPLVEAAVFLEPHSRTDNEGNRVMHLNCLTRCAGQHTWTNLARAFRARGVAVDFADHIKTWYDGVVYGAVESDHKKLEDLDQAPLQWASNGAPTPLKEVLPARWHQGRRASKLTPLQMHDLFTQKGVTNADEAWALASQQAEGGDRGLLGALLDMRDVDMFVSKVL